MTDNTKSLTDNDQFCPVCKNVAKYKCGACNNVYYCSREHQKADWKKHLKQCCPYRLVVDPTIGRRYVATRNLDIDELVLCENKPLLLLPSTEVDSCLNCNAELTTENTRECDNCGWRLCQNCDKHETPECTLTLKYYKTKVNYEKCASYHGDYVTAIIVVLRALALRDNEPVAYGRYMEKEDHCVEEAKRTANQNTGRKWAAKRIKDYMNIDDSSVDEIAKIIGIFEINCIDASIQPKCVRAVYDKASYFEHSCHPNSFWTVRKNDGSLVVRAIATIQKGEPITVSYLDAIGGTVDRREALAETKYFYCNCERCKDPTEFGTMFNAIKCIKEKCKGYMLPPTFLVSYNEKIPDYICNNCNVTQSSENVDKMLENIKLEYSQVDKSKPYELKKFIKKQSKILHINHYKIFIAELKLSVEISLKPSFSTLTVKLLKEYMDLYKKMTFLIMKLMPGKYFQRGLLLYLMYLAQNALIIREKPKACVLVQIVKDYKDVLSESHRMLLLEPVVDAVVEKAHRVLRELTAAHKRYLKKY